MDNKLFQRRSDRLKRDGYEVIGSTGFKCENLLRRFRGEKNHPLDRVRTEVLKRRGLIGGREFRFDPKLVEDEARRQIAAAAWLAYVDLTPVEVINVRDVNSGQDVQSLARNPEKVAQALMSTCSHLARQGLDGIRWNKRDVYAGIVEEREKVSLRSLAPLQPEVEPIALKGCGKVGDEMVIGKPIATRKDDERGLLACRYRGLLRYSGLPRCNL
jgi:hypothetical protein